MVEKRCPGSAIEDITGIILPGWSTAFSVTRIAGMREL
jgi:hypothetical protein